MIKNRKAQGMSIKIIIVAIIGLIILAIIVMMLSGRLGEFGGKAKLFGDNSKTCKEQTTNDLSDIECSGREITSSDAIAKGKHCCV